jgi:hypothetical protein
MTEDGDLIIRAFAQHPITQTAARLQGALRIGLARSVRPLPGRPAGPGLTVVTLAATSTTAWGEVDYRQRGIQPFTPGVDIKGLPQMDPPNRLGSPSPRSGRRPGQPALQRAGRPDRRHRHGRHDLQRQDRQHRARRRSSSAPSTGRSGATRRSTSRRARSTASSSRSARATSPACATPSCWRFPALPPCSGSPYTGRAETRPTGHRPCPTTCAPKSPSSCCS